MLVLLPAAERSASAQTAGKSSAPAPDRITVRADLLFYGDNTEFRNPFREGETIFGATGRVVVAAALTDRVTVSLGALGNQRFGGRDAFELVRPVASLEVRTARSSFLFGTFPARAEGALTGPDLGGPHGLLPPLQRETLTFDRPYEAGLQWTFSSRVLTHEAWLEWQRLNTAEHRERFDAGLAGAWAAGRRMLIPFGLHIVHEGGQLFASGPVADSVAASTGVIVRGRLSRGVTVRTEAQAVVSRVVPDRESPARTRAGAGMFLRASAERAPWRAHVIFWRGDDVVKDEGDPNYLSLRRDGRYYRGIRDYAEAGLTRTFHPAPGVAVMAAARLHRTERHYEYSYRILGRTSLGWPVR